MVTLNHRQRSFDFSVLFVFLVYHDCGAIEEDVFCNGGKMKEMGANKPTG